MANPIEWSCCYYQLDYRLFGCPRQGSGQAILEVMRPTGFFPKEECWQAANQRGRTPARPFYWDDTENVMIKLFSWPESRVK
jgi:hypothetical protein